MKIGFALIPLLVLTTSPVAADQAELLEFMGGQGCTFGADSRAAAVEAGFAEADIDALTTTALLDGAANQEGAYVVLSEELCTIRLPDIPSRYKTTSPEIVAITSAVDAFVADGDHGCFLLEPIEAFDKFKGGAKGAGYLDYLRFVASAMVAGDLTAYGTDPLHIFPGFQVVTGNCAQIPHIQDIQRSHQTLAFVFGPMIRKVGAERECGDDDRYVLNDAHSAELLRRQKVAQLGFVPANEWMWAEVTFIAIGAGWYENMTATEMGTPRPPLCHYRRNT
ncbi:hypothetical protein [Neogemmobacter tilapiae]|uniref:Uncharacterized protein n=1 Tax=Neogemmobacter tilapiae TaxID=875041 RepID=A0A918WJW6_9RHOB|nr:hypothetical protein [Gemmobacter tilapiae]GHC58417.1 hypothetical protein GCM10007315_22600 [Gemmobacter tilapiae]